MEASMEVNFPEPRVHSDLGQAIASFSKDGYASPNRFEVLIIRPNSSTSPTSRGLFGDSRKISLRCESINLPGRNLNTLTDSNIYGPTREVVNGVTYAEDINMTFQASSELEERVFFEEWQALAFDERSWNVNYYNDYISTVDIYIFDKQNRRRFGIKLMEAFPKTIGATDLGQGINNELIKLPVTFSFRYWTTLDTRRVVSLASNESNAAVSSSRSFPKNLPSSVTRLGGRSGGNVEGAYTGPEENYR